MVRPRDLHTEPQDLNLEYTLTLPQCSTCCTLKHKCSDTGYFINKKANKITIAHSYTKCFENAPKKLM